jgi:hypothetical protein
MFTMKRIAVSALALATAALLYATPAPGQGGGIKVGTLTCNVAPGWGFVLGSARNVNCTFAGPYGYENYSGTISKFGVDIGFTRSGVIIWTVVAPTAALAPGSLAGTYVGGTGSATLGVGIGVNALVGGSANTVALQPLSIEGSRGVDVAGGIGALTLVWRHG